MLNNKIITNYDYKNYKILYAEDEKDINETTTKFLKNINMDVTSVFNGEERLKCLKENNYDILITDINMPKIGGIELIENAIKINPDIKILVISAYSDTNDLLRIIQYKIERYILKPLQMEELLFSIYKCSLQIE